MDLAPGIHFPSFSLLKEEVFPSQVSGVLSQMIVLLTPMAFLGAYCSPDFREPLVCDLYKASKAGT